MNYTVKQKETKTTNWEHHGEEGIEKKGLARKPERHSATRG